MKEHLLATVASLCFMSATALAGAAPAIATTIGHKRLLRFPPMTTSKVRLTILDARDTPSVREFGLYKASAKEQKLESSESSVL